MLLTVSHECLNWHKPMYQQGNSHAVNALIWYLKYTCPGP